MDVYVGDLYNSGYVYVHIRDNLWLEIDDDVGVSRCRELDPEYRREETWDAHYADAMWIKLL